MRFQNVCHIKTSVKRCLESKNFVTFSIKLKSVLNLSTILENDGLFRNLIHIIFSLDKHKVEFTVNNCIVYYKVLMVARLINHSVYYGVGLSFELCVNFIIQ